MKLRFHSSLYIWLHTQRPKHFSRMMQALAWFELAEFISSEAHRLNDDELDTGWFYVKEATRLIWECGCPSRVWPPKVQQYLQRKP